MQKIIKSVSAALALILTLTGLIPGFSVTADAAQQNFALPTESGSCGANGSNVKYKLYKDGTLVLTGSGKMKNYSNNSPFTSKNIKTIEVGDGITSIGECAFYDCDQLESVQLPDSITTIGEWAFYLCESLSEVNFPKGLKSIGEIAFAGCAVKYVTVPKSLTDIHSRAFEGCDIISYSVDKGNTVYSSDDNGILFNKNKSELIAYPSFRTASEYTIPGGVTSIAPYAFSCAEFLEKITISESVTDIGKYAFSSMRQITSVTIPGSVRNLQSYSFAWCYNLKEITICEGVKTIGSEAFYYDIALTEIKIPDSVTTVSDSAFSGCTGLKRVTLGKNVSSLGRNIFSECRNLTSISVSSSNKSYASRSGILYDKLLTNIIYIPSGIEGAITIPSSVSEFPLTLFEANPKITAINIESGHPKYSSADGIVYSTDGSTLILCPKGKTGEVKILSSVKVISDNAFKGCANITEVTIPYGVTEIGDYAFLGCTGLTSVELPDSVTKLGESAFAACSSLQYAKLSKNISTLNATFDDCGSLKIAIIQDGTTTIGERCFIFDYSLLSVYIPASVKAIENYAFANYRNQNFHIYYGGTEAQWKKIKITGENDGIDNAVMHYNCNPQATVILEGACGDNLTYALDLHGTLKIRGTGDMYDYKESQIPWRKFPVLALDLKEGITSACSFAFSDSEITEFTPPTSMVKLGDNCLQSCNKLSKITIHAGLTDIGKTPLTDCNSLTSVTVAPENPKYYSENNCLITKDTKELIAGCSVSVIPDDVKIIGECAFSGSDIKSIKIPYSVTEIGWEAFSGCSKLESIVIPDGIKIIPVHCFAYCGKLSSIVLPASVTYIDEGAFFECIGLTDIYFKGTAEQWSKVGINRENKKIHVISFSFEAGGSGFDEIEVTDKNPCVDNAKKTFEYFHSSFAQMRNGFLFMGRAATAGDILKDALTGSYMTDVGGSAVGSDKALATGMRLVLPGGKSYTVVVAGDVDGDSEVSSADARQALRASVGLESYAENSPQLAAADTDEDKKISSSDARFILRASVGLEDLSALLQ